MSLRFVDPPNVAPPAGSYRHMAVVPSSRRLLVIAGQIGNLLDGTIVDGLEAQYEQAIVNINAIVASEGGAPEDIARVTVFLVEKPDVPGFAREVDKKYFPAGPPAKSWVYVAGLFRPDVKVEIEAIAAVP